MPERKIRRKRQRDCSFEHFLPSRPPLSREEEIELAKRAAEGSAEAKEELLRAVVKFASKLAWRFLVSPRNLSGRLDYDELYSACLCRIWEITPKYYAKAHEVQWITFICLHLLDEMNVEVLHHLGIPMPRWIFTYATSGYAPRQKVNEKLLRLAKMAIKQPMTIHRDPTLRYWHGDAGGHEDGISASGKQVAVGSETDPMTTELRDYVASKLEDECDREVWLAWHEMVSTNHKGDEVQKRMSKVCCMSGKSFGVVNIKVKETLAKVRVIVEDLLVS